MLREVGFDEVFDSQATFRALLDSLSSPGKVCQIPRCAYQAPPPGFCPPALSILKTLCDHRVSFSIGGEIARADWIRYLEVNLATPFRIIENADYVMFDGGAYDAGFARMNRGSLEFPESSATALLCVLKVSRDGEDAEGPACDLVLSGPGVKVQATLSFSGLDPAFAVERQKANRHFPLGVDLFLVDAEGRVAAIPRTSTLEVA